MDDSVKIENTENEVEILNNDSTLSNDDNGAMSVDNGTSPELSDDPTDIEKPVSKRRERLYGFTKAITGFLLQILSLFITSCASILTFFSCGVAGFGIAVTTLLHELQDLKAAGGIYTLLFFGMIICTVILLIVAVVPASLGLVASVASIKAFFRKIKQHRPKPYITLCLGVISFLIGIVNIAAIFFVVMMLFGAFATFSVPSFL